MPVSLLDFFILPVLRCFCGAVLFRSLCPSPNSSYPFWLLALTFRSSRPAFCGRLTSPVSPANIHVHSSPCNFKTHSPSQALLRWVFGVSPGFAFWFVGGRRIVLWSFWPQVLIPPGLAALVFVARGLCCHALSHPPCLTRRSSGSAFGGPLT